MEFSESKLPCLPRALRGAPGNDKGEGQRKEATSVAHIAAPKMPVVLSGASREGGDGSVRWEGVMDPHCLPSALVSHQPLLGLLRRQGSTEPCGRLQTPRALLPDPAVLRAGWASRRCLRTSASRLLHDPTHTNKAACNFSLGTQPKWDRTQTTLSRDSALHYLNKIVRV